MQEILKKNYNVQQPSLALLGSGELGVRTVRVLRNGDGKKTKGFEGVICIASANQKGELVFLYT